MSPEAATIWLGIGFICAVAGVIMAVAARAVLDALMCVALACLLIVPLVDAVRLI